MKQGVDYFSLDCQLDSDFELVESEFGLTGFAVIIKLWQRIYGDRGYYCEWSDEVALLFAKKIGAGVGVVSEIVQCALKRGIFDKSVFEKYGVLTSSGIQRRYLVITKRRKFVEMKKQYLLLNADNLPENVYISDKNVSNFQKNDCISSQSKVKESKVKESKVKESNDANASSEAYASERSSCPYQKIMDLYNSICVSFPKIQSITGNRKKAVNARWNYYKNLETFENLFKITQSSDFMKGFNKRNWKADFDWLMNSDNMTKTLEGKYNNLKPSNQPNQPEPSYAPDSLEMLAMKKRKQQKQNLGENTI